MAAPHHTPSERDLELLSAYLDGELSDREREALEQRLSRDARLRIALNELRDTVKLLHDLPRLKAPRDFTLDPADFARPVPWWQRLLSTAVVFQVSGALGAAASVIVIVLALALGGDFSNGTAREPGITDGDSIALKASPLPEQAHTATAEAMRTSIAYAGDDLIQTTIIAQSTLYAGTPEGLLGPTGITSPSPPTMHAIESPDSGIETHNDAIIAGMEEGAVPEAQPFAAEAGEAAAQAQQSPALAAPPVQDAQPLAEAEMPQPTTRPTPVEVPGVAADADMAAEAEVLDTDAADAATAREPRDEDVTQQEQDAEAPVFGPVASPTPVDLAQVPTDQPVPAEPTAARVQRTVDDGDGKTQWWLAALGAAGIIVSSAIFIVGRRKARRQ